MTPDVDVVIVNWNSGSHLRSTLDALLATVRTDPIADIVVIDNASSDDSLKQIEDLASRIRLIHNSSNLGFAGGVNQGVGATTNPMVLLLNPDARPTPGAIGRLRSLLAETPSAGAAGGFVNPRYLPRALPTLTSLVFENLGFRPGRLASRSDGVVRVDQPAAAALMVRRAAFDQVGGFDATFYPAWYEDVEFSAALADAGWDSWFDPGAVFDHAGGYSVERMGKERFMSAYYSNQLRYARKRVGAGSVTVLKAALVVGFMARMATCPFQSGAYWRSLRRVLGE